nr:MAG TPA: hypothetical protein [Caudoviricetes sp.]
MFSQEKHSSRPKILPHTHSSCQENSQNLQKFFYFLPKFPKMRRYSAFFGRMRLYEPF